MPSKRKEHDSMYVDIDKRFRASLMEMNAFEVKAFIHMIRGASLEDRRTFNGVLRQLLDSYADMNHRD